MIKTIVNPLARIKLTHIFASNTLFVSALLFTQDIVAIYIQVIIGIIIIFHDIDDKYLKKSLAKKIEELQEHERSLELTIQEELEKNEKYQHKLFEQTRMAQMGEMISMIAHQWRQPLGAISATSIDLNMKLELEFFDIHTRRGRREALEYFNKALKNIDFLVLNLTTTIDDFRNFYKPNKRRETSSINRAIKNSCVILETHLNTHDIRTEQDYESSFEHDVYTNELMQVFLNIIQNSSDNFISNETIHPTIKIKTYDTKSSSVVEISDNGGGIPSEFIDKIFNPYFSTKDEKNGTGLGLYMSKIIIEQHHNARLTVQNIEDGVCFKVELFVKGEEYNDR